VLDVMCGLIYFEEEEEEEDSTSFEMI